MVRGTKRCSCNDNRDCHEEEQPKGIAVDSNGAATAPEDGADHLFDSLDARLQRVSLSVELEDITHLWDEEKKKFIGEEKKGEKKCYHTEESEEGGNKSGTYLAPSVSVLRLNNCLVNGG